MIRTLVLVGLMACVEAPVERPLAGVATTKTTRVEREAPLTVTVRQVGSSTYRADILGSVPQSVAISIRNDGDRPRDVSDLAIGFYARRGAVPFLCEPAKGVTPREPKTIAPHDTVTFERDLCSLPLPGSYVVDVTTATGDSLYVASFEHVVRPGETNVPRPQGTYPNVFGALGGDRAGVRYTRPQWENGAYHVVLRVTNASTVPVPLGQTPLMFRVTKLHQPFACTDTKQVAFPAQLRPGESATAKVPVTCLIDVKGKYEIHAFIGEVELGEIRVEVTSDPLLYLPIWPW